MSTNFNFRSTNLPPPPDITPYISKTGDQYVAGGAFGDVYRRHYTCGSASKEVAVKALRFRVTMDEDTSHKYVKMLRRELGIWKRLDHTNVVPFLGVAYGFGLAGTMSLVSLWMPNESLHTFLAEHDDNLGVAHRLQFLLDIANGLHYLHSLDIVHGDLNCHNVLLDADYTARLTDFGYASLLGNVPEELSYLQRSTARPGALRWTAPEQIESGEMSYRTIKSDIYSFGCVCLQGGLLATKDRSILIVLQVLSGQQPWSEFREEVAVVLCLAKGQKPGRPESRTMGDSHWNFIQRCWSPIGERPAAEGIIFTIQLFLSCCPQSRPLRDLLVSQSSHPEFLVGETSSLTQATAGALGKTVDFLDQDNQDGSSETSRSVASLQRCTPLQTQRDMADRKFPEAAAKTLRHSLTQLVGGLERAWAKLRNGVRRKNLLKDLSGGLRQNVILSRSSMISSSGTSWSLVSSTDAASIASRDSTCLSTPTGTTSSGCSVAGRRDALSATITCLRLVHRVADIASPPVLRRTIETVLHIAQLIQGMGGLHHAIIQVVENSAWLLEEITTHATGSQLSKDMKRTLGSFQRELNNLQKVVMKIKERGPIARFFLHDADIQAITACTTSIKEIYDKLEIKLAMDNRQAIARLENQLTALFHSTALRQCECHGISVVREELQESAQPSATMSKSP